MGYKAVTVGLELRLYLCSSNQSILLANKISGKKQLSVVPNRLPKFRTGKFRNFKFGRLDG